jgi:hypothetical protein
MLNQHFFRYSSMPLLDVRYLPGVLVGFSTFLRVAPILYRQLNVSNNKLE